MLKVLFMYIHKPLRITKGNNSQRNGPSSLLFIVIICPVDINVYARFDEIPSITLKDIKKTKRYGRTDAQTDGWTDNVKTVYPPTNTVCGGYNDTKILNTCIMALPSHVGVFQHINTFQVSSIISSCHTVPGQPRRKIISTLVCIISIANNFSSEISVTVEIMKCPHQTLPISAHKLCFHKKTKKKILSL